MTTRTLKQRAATRAKRLNKRTAQELPLLAWGGVAPTTSAEEQEGVVAQHDRFAEHCHRENLRHMEEAEAWGQVVRETVAGHVTPEELAALDQKRSAAPETGEYTADHWGREAKRLGLLSYVW